MQPSDRVNERADEPQIGPFACVGAFYPFYLSQHRVRWNRRMHFIGTTCLFLLVIAAVVLRTPWLLLGLPLAGYGFAWAGHFFFEKNRPATFTYPLYSLICDFRMYWDIWRGRVSA
jgi:hypothetical protein